MKLILKNKFGSISGASKVLDEKGEQAYIIKGSFASNTFSKKYKKVIMSMDKKKLFIVCNKRLHGLHRAAFIYDGNKKEIAIVKQAKLLDFSFDVEGASEKITIDRSGVTLGSKRIGSIMPGGEKMSLMDSYTIEVDDQDDAAFLVALTIAIDNMHDASNRSAKRSRH